MGWIRQTAEGVVFKAAIQPKGARNEIVGLKGDALKIKLTAPPVKGAANRMCVEFLAKKLKIRKSDVEIVRGKESRKKQILVRSTTRRNVELLLKPEEPD
jgi:uncharacterized protein (TIGR00251 family)